MELAHHTGKAIIPPFNDRNVISGQGTIGLEIATDAPEIDVILVPISGGGLISGIAAAITALVPTPRSSG